MKVFICNNCKRFTYESKECEFCGCKTLTQTHSSNFRLIEKSDREKAIEWWNTNHYLQTDFRKKYFKLRSLNSKISQEEIEQIWRKEIQQESFEDISVDVMREYKNSILKEKRSQVDFEMLRDAVFRSIPAMFGKHHQWGNHVENLQLFFDLLSKSSTFAHKAYKELNKLNTH